MCRGVVWKGRKEKSGDKEGNGMRRGKRMRDVENNRVKDGKEDKV